MALSKEEVQFFLFFGFSLWEIFVQLLNRSVKVTVWRAFGCLNVKLICVRLNLWLLEATG